MTVSMRARVLVVDDDPALAEMLGIVLRSEGFLPSFVPTESVRSRRSAMPAPTSSCST